VPVRRTASRPLDKLERTIAQRAKKPHEKSYTTQLLVGGVEKIGAKVREEAGELVDAAGEEGEAGREHFIREAADLVYHLLVLLRHKNVAMADVEAELARRFGVSGLEEKASRKKTAAPRKRKPVVKAGNTAVKQKRKPVARRRKR
jgi:phosphoribosyl-ATP pyrophosphohydrolase